MERHWWKTIIYIVALTLAHSLAAHPGNKSIPIPPKKKLHSTTHAQLQAVDKVTGTFSSITVAVGKSTFYKDLKIRLKYCGKSDQFSEPEGTAFLKIHQKVGEQTFKPLFSGWMFASSPAIHTLENHPRYSLWLTKCINLQKTSRSIEK